MSQKSSIVTHLPDLSCRNLQPCAFQVLLLRKRKVRYNFLNLVMTEPELNICGLTGLKSKLPIYHKWLLC